MLMETKRKGQYEAPDVKVQELDIEGVICASEVTGGNSINDWGNGGTTNDEVYM